jgi:Cu/Zn superoxide dismutase
MSQNSKQRVDGLEQPAASAGGAVQPGASQHLGQEEGGEHDGEQNDPLADLELKQL